MTMSDGAFETPKVRGPTSRRDRTLFDWNGGPDGATDGDTYKPKLILRDDYPIEYSCEDAIEGRTESLNEVWFRYDYDLTMDGEQDPVETRRAFEWSVLWNVGVELGLYNCSIDMQDSTPNGRRRLLQQEDEESTLIPELTRVIALGNEAEDQADIGAEECFSHEDGCRPMKGIMNAMYTGSERDAENMVLSLIQKVMSTSAVRVKGVAQVQYIGDRDSYEVPPASITNGGASSGNANPMQTFGMGIGIAVGAAVVIGLVVGIFVAKIIKKKSDKDSVTGDNVSVTSIEIMELDNEKKAEQPESKVESESSLAEKGSVASDSETPNMQESEGGVPSTKTQSQSLQSQRRRRKKKKKKKKTRMGLTRSNSINSMDTITEAAEEEEDSGDCESDFGSEYSTDDEDEFYLAKTGSTLSSDSPIDALLFPLEQVVESPRIQKLPPPPV